jgi:hypothetical protein
MLFSENGLNPFVARPSLMFLDSFAKSGYSDPHRNLAMPYNQQGGSFLSH